MKRLLLMLLLLPIYAEAQIITTIAGNGILGNSGNGGPATAAEFINLEYVAVDLAGNIYISDNAGSTECIRRINTAGIINTVAGNDTEGYSGDGGPATTAELRFPSGVAVDGAGNIYIADFGSGRIRKVDTTGIITTIAGNGLPGPIGDGGPATDASLNTPISVKLDETGNIYIADLNAFRIRKINTAGIITTIAGNGTYSHSGDGGPATAAGIMAPVSLAIDLAGNLYIAEEKIQTDTPNSGRTWIRKVNTSGIISTYAGNGTLGFSGDGGPAIAAQFNAINDLAVDSGGNLYVADANNRRIRRINTTGIISTYAGNGATGYGGDGGPATAAELSPYGLAVDESGNVYVTDPANYRVRKVSSIFYTGINAMNYSAGEVIIYPSPSRTSLTISASYNITSITITNLLGQTVYRNQYNSQQVQIDVSNLPSGMYLIKINGTEVRKFVKQ